MNTEIFETFWAMEEKALQRCVAEIGAHSPEDLAHEAMRRITDSSKAPSAAVRRAAE